MLSAPTQRTRRKSPNPSVSKKTSGVRAQMPAGPQPTAVAGPTKIVVAPKQPTPSVKQLTQASASPKQTGTKPYVGPTKSVAAKPKQAVLTVTTTPKMVDTNLVRKPAAASVKTSGTPANSKVNVSSVKTSQGKAASVALTPTTHSSQVYIPSSDTIKALQGAKGPFKNNMFFTDDKAQKMVAQLASWSKLSVPKQSVDEYTRSHIPTALNRVVDQLKGGKSILINCIDPRITCDVATWLKKYDELSTPDSCSQPVHPCPEAWGDPRNAGTPASSFEKRQQASHQNQTPCHKGSTVTDAMSNWFADVIKASNYQLTHGNKAEGIFPSGVTWMRSNNKFGGSGQPILQVVQQAWKTLGNPSKSPGGAKQLGEFTTRLFALLQDAYTCYASRAMTIVNALADMKKAGSNNKLANMQCVVCTHTIPQHPQHGLALMRQQLVYINTSLLWYAWVGTPYLWVDLNPMLSLHAKSTTSTVNSAVSTVKPPIKSAAVPAKKLDVAAKPSAKGVAAAGPPKKLEVAVKQPAKGVASTVTPPVNTVTTAKQPSGQPSTSTTSTPAGRGSTGRGRGRGRGDGRRGRARGRDRSPGRSAISSRSPSPSPTRISSPSPSPTATPLTAIAGSSGSGRGRGSGSGSGRGSRGSRGRGRGVSSKRRTQRKH